MSNPLNLFHAACFVKVFRRTETRWAAAKVLLLVFSFDSFHWKPAETDTVLFFLLLLNKTKKKTHMHERREDARTRNTNLAGAPTCGSLLSAAAAVWIITQPEAGKARHWSKQAFSVSHSGRLRRFLLEDSLPPQPPPPGSCSRSRRGRPCLRWPPWIINPSQNLLKASICLNASCPARRRSHDTRPPRQHDYWLTCRAKFRLLPGTTRIRAPFAVCCRHHSLLESSVFMRLSKAPALPHFFFPLSYIWMGKWARFGQVFWNAGQN